jgi:hypothetical protein
MALITKEMILDEVVGIIVHVRVDAATPGFGQGSRLMGQWYSRLNPTGITVMVAPLEGIVRPSSQSRA